jgi:hypothetical protein
VLDEFVHDSIPYAIGAKSAGLARCPRTAVAAATCGDTR